MADDLAEELKGGGFAKLGKVADPESYRGPKDSAESAIGNIGSRITSFYKSSRQALGIDKKAEPGMAPGTFAKFKAQYKKDHKGD
jgi:hypothetical protein